MRGRRGAHGIEQIIDDAVHDAGVRGMGGRGPRRAILMRLRRDVQSIEQFVHLPHAGHVKLFIGVDFARDCGFTGRGAIILDFHLGEKGIDLLVGLLGQIIETLDLGAESLFGLSGGNRRVIGRGLAFFYKLGEVDDLLIVFSNILGSHAQPHGG